MSNNKYQTVIEGLGLSRSEADVYMAALPLGPTTVLKIAEVSGLERTNIYRVIRLLQKKGLMSVEIKGLKTQYVAEDPSQLELVLESKREKFAKILPALKEMHGKAGVSSEIKYYRGLNGIKAVYEQLLKEIKLSDFYYVMSDLEKWHRLDTEYFDNFIKRRVRRGIRIQFLVQDSEWAKYSKKYENNFLQKVKILPKETLLETDTIVTPKKVIIIQFDEPITTFVIENKSLIQAHKQYFEIMWHLLDDTQPAAQGPTLDTEK